MLTHVSQLDHGSTWRKYLRNVKSLEKQGASSTVVEVYTYMYARESFLTFAYVMTDGYLLVEPFHELIGSLFEDLAYRRYHRAIISCPPRSGKSFLASLFLAWLIGRNDAAQHIIASYGQSLSNKLYSDAYNYLNHPHFKTIFDPNLPNKVAFPSGTFDVPKIGAHWHGFAEKQKRVFDNHGRVLVTSVGGAVTGFTAGTLKLYKEHHDWGCGATIIDDPLKGSSSIAEIQGLPVWWAEQASTRRTNNWCQLVIATRFSVNDLHGILLKSDGLYDKVKNPLGWRWLNIPAICEDEANDPLGRINGESHWPTNPLFTTEILEQQKLIMGANSFSALYQGTPIAGEGSMVKPHQVIFKKDLDRRDCTHVWLSIDTAYTEKQTSDDSVITVMGTNPKLNDGMVYIFEMIAGKFAFPQLLETVKNIAKHYRTRTVVIENKASGISLIQMLEQQTKLHVVPMKADKSKTIRLQMVLHLFESLRVHFKEGAWQDELYDQLTQFPLHPHDDYVDSLVHGLLYYLVNLDSNYRQAMGDNHNVTKPANPNSSGFEYAKALDRNK
ncbi:MAG: phage terminase large subunit, partial [Nitrososphaeraceae archaeon]|nr:phage terminase large subunit [Nitrososphaeraceae archaeon]